MKIYVAASFPRKSDALQLAFKLMKQGHDVTSGWLEQVEANKNETADGYKSDRDSRRTAERDIKDIDAADALVMITGDSLSGGGRRFEAGYAFGKGRPIFLFGSKEIIFDHLTDVHVVSSFSELLAMLKTYGPPIEEPESS